MARGLHSQLAQCFETTVTEAKPQVSSQNSTLASAGVIETSRTWVLEIHTVTKQEAAATEPTDKLTVQA